MSATQTLTRPSTCQPVATARCLLHVQTGVLVANRRTLLMIRGNLGRLTTRQHALLVLIEDELTRRGR